MDGPRGDRRDRCRAAPWSISAPESGQVLPLMAVTLLFVLLIGFGLSRLAGGLSDRARARTAADAAAIAGARDGEDGAARVAEDNHALLEQYVARSHQVEVTVRVGKERATARATLHW